MTRGHLRPNFCYDRSAIIQCDMAASGGFSRISRTFYYGALPVVLIVVVFSGAYVTKRALGKAF